MDLDGRAALTTNQNFKAYRQKGFIDKKSRTKNYSKPKT